MPQVRFAPRAGLPEPAQRSERSRAARGELRFCVQGPVAPFAEPDVDACGVCVFRKVADARCAAPLRLEHPQFQPGCPAAAHDLGQQRAAQALGVAEQGAVREALRSSGKTRSVVPAG